MNTTSCLLIQMLDLTGQDLLGKKRLLWAVSSEPIEPPCTKHKQAAVTEMLPCKEQYWGAHRNRLAFNNLARGNTSFSLLRRQVAFFCFLFYFLLTFFWGAITCHLFSHFSPTLSLSTVFCDVLEAMEMVSGWLLPSPWLSASSIPSLQEMIGKQWHSLTHHQWAPAYRWN